MSSRADYTAGLLELAVLLDANPELALPFEAQNHMTVFLRPGADNGRAVVDQTLSYVQAMRGPVTATIAVSSNRPEIRVEGRIAGLPIMLRLYLNQSSERRVTGVHRASDGSVHEVVEYVIPAELLAAVERSGSVTA